MSEDPKPNPGDDVKKAFGLLFRAAKTAVDQLPSKKIEDVVTLGAKEVGRAIENVADTIEKEFFGGSKPKSAPPPPVPRADHADHADEDAPPSHPVRIGEDPPKT